jgi:dUTP pyrophosphatase
MELAREYLKYYTKVNTLLENKNKLLVKLMNTQDPIFIPSKKYPSDAGYDCRARLDEPLTIPPGGRACIPLGFAINIPLHHTGDLRPRSGLTKDYGIMVGYGTIDAGYTGEVKATVFNFGQEPFTIYPKDRIAQLVILPTVHSKYMDFTELELVDELVELERGANGHGSTGVK